MTITLIAVGRLASGALLDQITHYQKRLPWTLDIREIDIRKKLPTDARRAEEARQMLAAIPKGAHVIALDERGRDIRSRDFAAMIGGLRDQAVRDIVFLIGGADGLDEEIKQRADHILNFGQMTWPHMLVRVMLAEQIYRAWSILTGHPYHREG